MEGRVVRGLRRLGKRIVFDLGDQLFMVFHLMIAGRFRWKERGATAARKIFLAALDFPKGTLVLTEASPKKRASLYCVRGEEALRAHDPGGIDVYTCSLAEFHAALTEENHTIKRTLTDPRVLSGIGNAYSDEILWRARLSPVKWTTKLDDAEVERLFAATKETLTEWTERLDQELHGGFPDKVTAFRPEMAVHGKFGEPCPRCGAEVQRIKRADNEVNYCPTCQTEGKLLADRGLSRLLKGDWPKTLEEMEELKRSRKA
jgi:formamidopyrimidine-DNA glycosylase